MFILCDISIVYPNEKNGQVVFRSQTTFFPLLLWLLGTTNCFYNFAGQTESIWCFLVEKGVEILILI